MSMVSRNVRTSSGSVSTNQLHIFSVCLLTYNAALFSQAHFTLDDSGILTCTQVESVFEKTISVAEQVSQDLPV